MKPFQIQGNVSTAGKLQIVLDTEPTAINAVCNLGRMPHSLGDGKPS